MKKLLLCAGVLAVMASCAKYDVDTPSTEKAGKGIVFEAAVADDATRGGFTPNESSYTPYWYAEQDKIAIYADNAILGDPGTITGQKGQFERFYASAYAEYKATKSANKGEFTSVEWAKTWNFNYNTDGTGVGKMVTPAQGDPYYTQVSNFFALYPSTLAGTSTTSYTDAAGTTPAKFTVKLTDNLAAQTQTDAKGAGVYDLNVKWSYTQGEPAEKNDAVGEKVNLDFQRENVGVVFSTKGTDQYADYFGALASVKLEAKGYTNTTTPTQSIPASLLTYGTTGAKLEVSLGNKATSKLTYGTGAVSTVTTEIGFAWTDAAKAYMIIAPHLADATKPFTEAKPETYVATYTFKNITFTQTVPSLSEYEAGEFRDFPVLDVTDPDKYPYFVVKETDGVNPKTTLIVNKYSASMFADKSATDKDYVVWPIGTTKQNANGWEKMENFTDVISVDAWNADLTKLAKFKKLATLELYADTELPKDMLKDVEGLTTLIATEVTKIDPDYTNKKYAMVDLELPAYEFNSDVINASFFEKSATTLVTLDMASQKSFEAKFSEFKTISFKDFTALETVTLNENGTFVKSEAFAGCTSLEEVNGKVDVTGLGVTKVFKDCAVLPKVALTSTVIPDETFSGCSVLKDVIVNGAQVVPTKIGASAFLDCGKLELMDLKNATEIGAAAFKNCVSYIGVKDAKKDGVWLEVPVKVVSEGVFMNTALVNVKFTEATTIQPDIFRNNTKKSLKHVQFNKVIAADTAVEDDTKWKLTFTGIPETVYFYVNEAQTTVKDNTLTLKWTVVSGQNTTPHTVAWTFANIATVK